MIKQIFDISGVKLTDSYYGRKIRAGLEAYGTKYDFCRLFQSESGGHMLIYNSSVTVDGNFNTEELSEFTEMLDLLTIEVSSDLTLHLCKAYQAIPRTLFKAVPGKNDILKNDVKLNTLLDRIYPILKESFGIDEFDMWYTDISHRIRHGISDIYLYKSTTVTKEFDIDGFVFLSHIATAEEERGKGTAGNLLRLLCGEFESQGKGVYLYAEEKSRGFYKMLGFSEVYEDIIYEKMN